MTSAMRHCWLLALAACAELPPARGRVPVTNADPRGCAAVEAVEIRSAPRECPSIEMLRAYASERGANYVVLDAFSVRDDDEVVTLGRLFACPR
jgi:hypothetical protein